VLEGRSGMWLWIEPRGGVDGSNLSAAAQGVPGPTRLRAYFLYTWNRGEQSLVVIASHAEMVRGNYVEKNQAHASKVDAWLSAEITSVRWLSVQQIWSFVEGAVQILVGAACSSICDGVHHVV